MQTAVCASFFDYFCLQFLLLCAETEKRGGWGGKDVTRFLVANG